MRTGDRKQGSGDGGFTPRQRSAEPASASHLTPLFLLTLADFIVRSAYQMGKTPLLPIFAVALGASDALLGFIVSVSTLTGMVLKPLVGLLSDRWGRRSWLIVGTCFFALMPFVYPFVETPQQLVVVRVIHGLATAIYGPVTLAYIAGRSKKRLAEKLGWFGLAKEGGYVVGPLLAGWLLLSFSPQIVFTVIGLLSSLAFIPVLALPEPERVASQSLEWRTQLHRALKTSRQSASIWFSGGLEATNYIVLYALKTFLPFYALSIGINVAVVGTFFALQEAVDILLRPFSGRLSDRLGYLRATALGMAGLSLAVLLAIYAHSPLTLLASALLIGAAQALIFPAILALVSHQVDEANIGFSLGLVGSLSNVGKVIGPIAAGLLIAQFDYTSSFQILCFSLLLASLFVGIASLKVSPTPRSILSQSSGD